MPVSKLLQKNYLPSPFSSGLCSKILWKLIFLIVFEIPGHCPHDEMPEEVNSIICEWIVTLSSKRPVVSFK